MKKAKKSVYQLFGKKIKKGGVTPVFLFPLAYAEQFSGNQHIMQGVYRNAKTFQTEGIKMKKWTIIAVAVLFVFGLSAPGWAVDEVEVEVAVAGEQAATGESTNVGENQINDNELGSNNTDNSKTLTVGDVEVGNTEESNNFEPENSLNDNRVTDNSETETLSVDGNTLLSGNSDNSQDNDQDNDTTVTDNSKTLTVGEAEIGNTEDFNNPEFSQAKDDAVSANNGGEAEVETEADGELTSANTGSGWAQSTDNSKELTVGNVDVDNSDNTDNSKDVDLDVDIDKSVDNASSADVDGEGNATANATGGATANASSTEIEAEGDYVAVQNNITEAADTTTDDSVGDNSNNEFELDIDKSIKSENDVEAEEGSAATVVGDATTTYTEDSNNTDTDVDLDIDKSIKSENDVEAEEGSAATIIGDATSTNNEAEEDSNVATGSASIDQSDNSDNSDNSLENEAETGGVAALGGNATKTENESEAEEGSASSINGNATSTYTETEDSNNNESEASGEGSAAVTGSGSATSNYDESTREAEAEGSSAASFEGDATVDQSINIDDVNVAVSSTELNSQVSGNAMILTSGSSAPEGGCCPSIAGIDTGKNKVSDITSNGISAINQNSGVQSSTQQSVNVNASVGSIQ